MPQESTFLTTWAPLITVAGACAVALIQQRGITKREKEERRRKLLSARATLPLTLGDVQQKIVGALGRIRAIHESEVVKHSSNLSETKIFDRDEMLNLRDCIAHQGANEETTRPFYYLIIRIQITQARLNAIFTSS